MQVVYLVGSSMVYLTPVRRCSLVFGSKLFTAGDSEMSELLPFSGLARK